jgi:hypothetical protein
MEKVRTKVKLNGGSTAPQLGHIQYGDATKDPENSENIDSVFARSAEKCRVG